MIDWAIFAAGFTASFIVSFFLSMWMLRRLRGR